MQLQNEFTVPAPVSEVWKTLLDVQRITPCLPGATVDRAEGDEVAGRLKVKVGPIMVSYAGTARFAETDETAHRFVLEASGRETRGSGTAAATVEVTMQEEGPTTRVTLLTDLDITGKPAQFGRGVMADVAGKLTDQFAACLAGQVGAPAGAAAGPASTTRPAARESTAPDGERGAAVPQRVAGPQAADSLDLFSAVGLPVAKRFAPVLAGMVLGVAVGALFGGRRRVVIVIPQPPLHRPPAAGRPNDVILGSTPAPGRCAATLRHLPRPPPRHAGAGERLDVDVHAHCFELGR